MHPTTSNRRSLLIDAMGTLVRLEPPAPALRRELARRFGIEVSPAQAQRAVAAEIGYYRAHMQDGRDAASVHELQWRCAGALRTALPRSERLRRIDGFSLTAALLASLRFSAYADARPALEAARDRGERVIVVSNWDASLADVLARVGLEPLLDGVVTSADAGVRKPQRQIFERALELAGVPAERAVHVGDSLEEDVAGARAAGIAAVWVNRPHPPRQPGPPGFSPAPGPSAMSGAPEVATITGLSELGAAILTLSEA